ncbi:MAG: GNAT family N-acetyltransferase [Acidobacteriota bacterium]|nr:GNAT family N-acetyltransferase [Acidobacteriota bacterium]
MSDIQYAPINHLDESAMLPLMKEERQMWLADLDWDYSAIQQILLPLIGQKMLPGYAAFTGGRQPSGYIYFLANREKGSIGALYTMPADNAQKAAEGLVELAIACLQDSGGIRRVEAQIFPFHGQNYERIFSKYGFRHYPRVYLVRNIDAGIAEKEPASPAKIIPWDSTLISRAAGMTTACYREHIDYEILEDYHTPENCENYLRGLVTNPGCGVFLPDASFICLDGQENICGYVICSRISDRRALIPQIAAHPAWQGRGLGAALMNRCLRRLRSMNFRSISLVVTSENSRACEWYQRMGFQPHREFGAFTWNRS